MKQYIGGTRIANDVMLLRDQYYGAIVIVEGVDDVKFFHRYFDQSQSKVLPAHKKGHVIDAIKILATRSAEGILGVVDCDFSYLDGDVPEHPNIVVTDFHDVETLIIMSPALDNILREIVPSEEIDLLDNFADNVRNVLFEAGSTIGFLRWVTFREKLGLKFKGISFERIFDSQEKIIDLELLFDLSQENKETGCKYSYEKIKEKATDLAKKKPNLGHVCQGHDLVSLLVRIIPVVFKDTFSKEILSKTQNKALRSTEKDMSSKLRLAYDTSFFRETQQYKSIKNWEKGNSPYKVLGD